MTAEQPSVTPFRPVRAATPDTGDATPTGRLRPASATRSPAGPAMTQGSLALSPAPQPAAVPRPPLRLVRPGERGAPHPAVPPWVRTFVQLVAEALAGCRPVEQLAVRMTAEAYGTIRRVRRRFAAPGRPRVHSVRVFVPAPGAAEVSAVVGFGPRVRALALRLDLLGHEPGRPVRPAARPRVGGAGPAAPASRWICTALKTG